jgi:hypothetical protein
LLIRKTIARVATEPAHFAFNFLPSRKIVARVLKTEPERFAFNFLLGSKITA